MQHHFSAWSRQLPSELWEHSTLRLQIVERALTQAEAATPQAFRRTELAPLPFSDPVDDLSVLVLECAQACRTTHPDDFQALCAALKVTLKGKAPKDATFLGRLLDFLAEANAMDPKLMPVDEVLDLAERLFGGQPVPREWHRPLETIRRTIDGAMPVRPKSVDTLLTRIKRLTDDSISTRLKPDEGWCDVLLQDLQVMSNEEQVPWQSLLREFSSVFPEPPVRDWDIAREEISINLSEDIDAYLREQDRLFFERQAATTWHATVTDLIHRIDEVKFAAMRLRWLQAVPGTKPGTLSQFSINRELLRGLLWTCDRTNNPELVRAIRIAAEYLFRNNSPLGRTAGRILAHAESINALDELTHLGQQVKAQIQVRLIEAARLLVAQRAGIPAGALSERPLPASGFTEIGRRVELWGELRAELTVTGASSAELAWFKPDGRRVRSLSEKVKREYASAIENLKAAKKEVQATLATGREQLESAPLRQCSWTIDEWRKLYFNHPILGTLCRNLLWNFDQAGEIIAGAFDGQTLRDLKGRELPLGEKTRVSLWHPLKASNGNAPIAEVLEWRNQFAVKGLTQPFKQLYREIYLLTDAERITGTYSNRFAAHILNQPQFRALAKARGWTADYMGGWDGGDGGKSERKLREWNLRAEFLTDGVEGSGHLNAGGYQHVATDQVRFFPLESRDPLPLSDVPPLAFSEIMRDVDLFVAVASVGNDPTWSDGGPDRRHAAYWEGYAFGPLTETAVTRRAALEQIVPRLRIADRCTFDDRYLIVRGQLHTYRIHLGSGNIRMEPNNTYLCIVEARTANRDANQAGPLFLPFEGDSRLSVILSKALLLAEDTSITDPTIRRQLDVP